MNVKNVQRTQIPPDISAFRQRARQSTKSSVSRIPHFPTYTMRRICNAKENQCRCYRQAAAYACVAAAVAAGLGGMLTANIALEGLRRAVAALNDLGAVAALRKGL
jgi:hypothetical protein